MKEGDFHLQAEFLDEAAFQAALDASPSPIPVFKSYQVRLSQALNQQFSKELDADVLVRARSKCIDFLLTQAWALHIPTAPESKPVNAQLALDPDTPQIALVAVGGYGRGELHPHSDIDLLVLLNNDLGMDCYRESLQTFITFLWDIKLNVGHSVRTLAECHSEAGHDLSIMTNLLERRLVSGDKALFQALTPYLNDPELWPTETFFLAKWDEQEARHNKYQTDEHNLEPNIKGSPGGLRDLHVIGWVCQRHLGTSSLKVLKESQLLNTEEYQALEHSRRFLWQVRYALHMLAGREENRLLFHFQRQVAELLGYESNATGMAVEHFMQQFYRIQHEVIELNDLIFTQLRERHRAGRQTPVVQPLNDDFQLIDQALAIKSPERIEEKPRLLLEAFYLMVQHPDIQGIRSTTIRALRNYRHLIDEDFRNNAEHAELFLGLLKGEDNVVRECNRMMRYGILGNYIPEFGRIIGRMQHDLFHVFTFDEHSLRTLRLIRAIRRGEEKERFPIASRIIQRLPQKSVLYLAALLHDIGKAEEGAHEIKGARLVKRICRRYKLPRRESLLLTWLVRNHLLLSHSAQRENLMDPEVAHRLAIQIRDRLYLDYLYVLSVADIVSTNPSLWTGWRAQQMRQAYNAIAKAIDYGLHSPADPKAWIKDKKQQALKILEETGIEAEAARRFWSTLDAQYFLEFPANALAHQTWAVLTHHSTGPLISISDTSDRQLEGATSIFVYTQDEPHLFARLASILDQLNLVVLEAQIMTSQLGYALDTFIVLDDQRKSIQPNSVLGNRIVRTFEKALEDSNIQNTPVNRRTPRQLRAFPVKTEVNLIQDPNRAYDLLEIRCADRPGLLAHIGRVVAEFPIDIQGAKILTEGERVEDIFFIRKTADRGLTADISKQLQERLQQALNSHIEAQA